MAYLLLGLLMVSALSIRTIKKRGVYTIDLVETAWLSLTCYGIFVVASLPLAWFDFWSITSHLISLWLISVIPIFFLLKRIRDFRLQIRLLDSRISLVSFLAILIVGIALQWEPIYYLYATHDPSAYLNSAIHLTRSGHFFHHDDLVRLAYSGMHDALKPLLNIATSPKAWQLTRNFGVIPNDLSKGTGSYHGLFAAPMFLALGMALFGMEHALRIHWVHLACSLLLLRAILLSLLPEKSKAFWVSFGLLLFVTSPLIPTIFREPLSEPLAQVFFLGLVFSLLRTESDFTSAKTVFLLCLVGALCTRVSGLLYLPFAFVPKFGKRFHHAAVVTIAVSVAVMARLSPTYVKEILQFYSQVVLQKLPPALRPEHLGWIAVLGVLIVAAGVFLQSRRFLKNEGAKRLGRLQSPRVWRAVWTTYFCVLALGIFIRYFRLVTALDHNIGGFPFVLFNLDSLLFYAGPVLVVLGLTQVFILLYQLPINRFFFLQTYLPFCLFFYSVYRFIPLNLQVNFQRYLIIELVPISIVGCVIALARLSLYRRMKPVVTAVFSFIFVWGIFLTYSINHFDMCRHTFHTYDKLVSFIDDIKKENKRPVVVAIQPDWRETTYLLPLSNGFDIPVVFLNQPLDEEGSAGLNELVRLGYTPIFAARSDAPTKLLSAAVGFGEWSLKYELRDCYRYPQFGLGAPPLELSETCASLNFHTVPEIPRLLATIEEPT